MFLIKINLTYTGSCIIWLWVKFLHSFASESHLDDKNLWIATQLNRESYNRDYREESKIYASVFTLDKILNPVFLPALFKQKNLNSELCFNTLRIYLIVRMPHPTPTPRPISPNWPYTSRLLRPGLNWNVFSNIAMSAKRMRITCGTLETNTIIWA